MLIQYKTQLLNFVFVIISQKTIQFDSHHLFLSKDPESCIFQKKELNLRAFCIRLGNKTSNYYNLYEIND